LTLPRQLPPLIALLLLAPGPQATATASIQADRVAVDLAHEDMAGSTLPATLPYSPLAPIGSGTHPIEASLERARRGNLHGARLLLSDWLEGRLPQADPRARSRWTAARFQLGLLHLEAGDWNLASEQFTKVRASGGSLEAFGAWYEAVADYRGGRFGVAARECRRYRQRWPEGIYADDCLLLMGDAYVAAGYTSPAHQAYQEFIELEPDGDDVEPARLGKALATANHSPKAGSAELRHMALNYRYPTTNRAALAALADLAPEGEAPLAADDVQSRIQLAVSARRAKEYVLAWELLQELLHDEDAQARSWAESQLETFAWRTHRYRILADIFAERYQAAPDAETCWLAHRALARGGYWQEAAEWAQRGRKEHVSHHRWRHATEHEARAWMMAGQPERARELWDKLARTGGSLGREAAWYAAFCAWRAGSWDLAAERLEQVMGSDGARATRARYYRAKVALAQGDEDRARQELRAVQDAKPNSWYGLLASSRLRQQRSAEEAAAPAWLRRTGRWPLPASSPRSDPAAVRSVPPSPQVAPWAQGAALAPAARALQWSTLAWRPAAEVAAVQPGEALPAGEIHADSGIAALQGYPPLVMTSGPLFNAAESRAVLSSFVARHRELWPDLPAALTLADAGAYELAGRVLEPIYDEIEQAKRGKGPRALQLRAADLDMGQWRRLFLYARAWHLASRFSMGLHKYVPAEHQRQALAMAYPAAYPEHVWRSSRSYDVDPLLVLAVMRQESQYKVTALSSAGAVGLMQVMPSTGALVARDLGAARYSPRDLLEPASNIQYGTWYLNRLLARYQGCTPLAVAAYNAGPTNVSSWYRPWKATNEGETPEGEKIGIDDLVEMIPIDETRNYVRRVMGFYQLHATIYGPEGAHVAACLTPGGDDPATIDY